MRDRFLRACWREPVDRTPVWFMRQAGRSSPSYRALRARHGILEMAKKPDLAAEVTLQPVRELGVDAAVLFSDLLLPLEAMGVEVTIEEGHGPALRPRIHSAEDVARLASVKPERHLSYVLDTIRRVRERTTTPLLGFAGAPFTLASYLIEGGPCKDFGTTKRFLRREREAWRNLMDHLVEQVGTFLRDQVRSGAQALQVFDSWAGALDPSEYEIHVLPWSRKLLRSLEETGVPVIHFGTRTGPFLEAFRSAGGHVIGIDSGIPLDEAWRRIGEDRGIQGNLDPKALLGPPRVWRSLAEDVLRRAGGRAGHIFNLGHGVLPETPQASLRALVRLVHGQGGG